MCSKFYGSSDKSCQDNLPETKIERKSPGCILGEPWTSVSPIQLVDVEIFPGKSMIRRPVSESKYCWCSRQSMLCVSTPPTSRGECAHPLFIFFHESSLVTISKQSSSPSEHLQDTHSILRARSAFLPLVSSLALFLFLLPPSGLLSSQTLSVSRSLLHPQRPPRSV